jgi:hypothetical protein
VVTELAELWLLACSHENERLRSAAWTMLGRWAQSCREYPDLGGTFIALADEFEKVAGGDDLRGRLGVYRDAGTATSLRRRRSESRLPGP